MNVDDIKGACVQEDVGEEKRQVRDRSKRAPINERKADNPHSVSGAGPLLLNARAHDTYLVSSANELLRLDACLLLGTASRARGIIEGAERCPSF